MKDHVHEKHNRSSDKGTMIFVMVAVFLSTLCLCVCISDYCVSDANSETSGVDGGIQWSYSNQVLTIGPASVPEKGYESGQMKNYDSSDPPWPRPGVMYSIQFLDGVKNIGNYAFYDNMLLRGSIILPDSVTTIGNGAFYKSFGFQGTLAISDSVTDIGTNAFNGCIFMTGSLTIPDSVVNIGSYAFSGCKTFSGPVTLGKNVKDIQVCAFSGCGGSGFVLNGNTNFSVSDGVLYNKDKTEIIACPVGKTGPLTLADSTVIVGSNAFENCSKITGNLTFPSNLTTIKGNAFYGCSGITGSLSINDGITEIGYASFHGCKGFNGTLYIGSGISTIPIESFYGCSGFTGALSIPDNIKSIGYGAFDGCSKFTSLTISDEVQYIGESAFNYCSGLSGDLKLPDNLISIGRFAFENCKGLNGTLTMGDNLKSIGDLAFYGDCFTGELVLSQSLESLGKCVFQNCTGFTGDLIIPGSMRTIDDCAFANCTGLSGTLLIPASVTRIGDAVFYGCTGFTNISIVSTDFSIASSSPFSSSINFYKEDGTTLITSHTAENLGGYEFTGTSDKMIRGKEIRGLIVDVSDAEAGFVNGQSRVVINVDKGTPFTITGNTLTIDGTTIVASPNESSEHYTCSFTGWSASSGTVTNTTRVVANFSKIGEDCNIYFDVSDPEYGSVSKASIVAPYGSTISVNANNITINGIVVTATPSDPTAQYTYKFTRWHSDSWTVVNEMTITAELSREVNKYGITFAVNNPEYGSVSKSYLIVPYGSSITVDGDTVTVNDIVAIATPAPATAQYTYSFQSWDTESTEVTSAMTITATFVATENQYKVTFIDGTAKSEQTATYGHTVTRVMPDIPTDKAFLGWFDGDVLWDFENDKVTRDIELIAKWKEITGTSLTVDSGSSGTCEIGLSETSNITELTIAGAGSFILIPSDSIGEVKGKILIATIKVSNDNAFEIQLRFSDSPFTGRYTVSLPYDSTTSDTPHVIWRHGGIYDEMSSSLDKESKMISFDTTHGGIFVVTYTSQPAENNYWPIVAIVVLILIGLGLGYWYYTQKYD